LQAKCTNPIAHSAVQLKPFPALLDNPRRTNAVLDASTNAQNGKAQAYLHEISKATATQIQVHVNLVGCPCGGSLSLRRV
jgi:hypothetical protein